jgi:hypothetical protein
MSGGLLYHYCVNSCFPAKNSSDGHHEVVVERAIAKGAAAPFGRRPCRPVLGIVIYVTVRNIPLSVARPCREVVRGRGSRGDYYSNCRDKTGSHGGTGLRSRPIAGLAEAFLGRQADSSTAARAVFIAVFIAALAKGRCGN